MTATVFSHASLCFRVSSQTSRFRTNDWQTLETYKNKRLSKGLLRLFWNIHYRLSLINLNSIADRFDRVCSTYLSCRIYNLTKSLFSVTSSIWFFCGQILWFFIIFQWQTSPRRVLNHAEKRSPLRQCAVNADLHITVGSLCLSLYFSPEFPSAKTEMWNFFCLGMGKLYDLNCSLSHITFVKLPILEIKWKRAPA